MSLLKHPLLKVLLKFGFAGGILIYMVVSGRLDLVVVKSGFAKWHLVFFVVALLLTATFASFVRWNLLLLGQGVEYSFWHIIRYGLIGCFFNTTMPGAVSGDLIKAWYVVSEHKGQEKTPVFASILLDRVMGVFGLVSVATIALIFGWGAIWDVSDMRGIAWIVLLLAFGMSVFFLYIMLSFWGPLAKLRSSMERAKGSKLGKAALKAYDAFMSYQKAPSILAKSLLLSMITHICATLAVMICANALGEAQISLYKFFLLVPLGLLTTAVPVAPAGLGVGHVAFGSLFSIAGSEHGAEIFTLYVTVQILVNLTGVFFYIGSAKRPLAVEEPI